MAEKHLTDAAWKTFAKGKGYKDLGLVRTLDELARAGKGPAEGRLQALDALEKQAEQLLKAHKGDKALADYIAELDKALGRERKQAERDAKAEQAAQQAAADADDEADTPAVLTTQIPALLRELRKGRAMHALVATAGRDAAVLISRKPISTARRKLLTDYLGIGGGAKFIAADCLFEAQAVTFVVATQAGGLAKRLKAALLAQAGLRLKVRVRGAEADDVDEDLEGDDDDGDGDGDDSAANTRSSTSSTPPSSRAEGAKDTASAKEAGRFVNHAKAKLTWNSVRQKVKADLQALEQAIRDEYGHRQDVPDLATKLRKLDTVLATLDESLSTTLDDALNAPDLAARAALHDKARQVVARYKAFVDTDPLVAAIDSNPFVPLNTHATLSKTLQVLDRSLA